MKAAQYIANQLFLTADALGLLVSERQLLAQQPSGRFNIDRLRHNLLVLTTRAELDEHEPHSHSHSLAAQLLASLPSLRISRGFFSPVLDSHTRTSTGDESRCARVCRGRLDAIALVSCGWSLRASPRPTALLTQAPVGDAGLALLLVDLEERAE